MAAIALETWPRRRAVDASNLLWAGAAAVVTTLAGAVGALWKRSGAREDAHLQNVERLLREQIESQDTRIAELEKAARGGHAEV